MTLLFFSCGASTQFRLIASPYRALQSHSLEALSFVEPLWVSDQPNAETTTWQHLTLTRNIHVPSRIHTQNLSNGVATDPPLRSHGHWNGHTSISSPNCFTDKIFLCTNLICCLVSQMSTLLVFWHTMFHFSPSFYHTVPWINGSE
jgi:hypothetical protein